MVGILSGNLTGITYYIFNASGFKKFLNKVLTYKPSDITEFNSTTLSQAVFDPIQYITVAKWYPTLPLSGNTGGTVTNIEIGPCNVNTGTGSSLMTIYLNFSASDKVYILSGESVERFRFRIAVPQHPDSASFGQNMNLAPNTQLNLLFPVFGDIPLDTTKINFNEWITVDWVLDYCSGSVFMQIMPGDLVTN